MAIEMPGRQAPPPPRCTLTRPLALRLIALLWVALGWGFSVVPGRPDAWPVIASIRAELWIIAGLWVLVTAGRRHLAWYGVGAMGILVGERITALLALQIIGESSTSWFSAATWAGIYLAVVFAASLPDPRGRR